MTHRATPPGATSPRHLPGQLYGPVQADLAAATLDATDSLVIVTDLATGTVVAINSAAEKIIGLPREQVAGRALWDICAPDDRAGVADLFAGPRLEHAPPAYEATTVDRSGAHHRVVWSSTFLTDATARPTHLVSTGVDVSSGRATSGLFGQLMLAATTIVLIGTDQGGRITYCSAGAERLLGATRDDGLVGRWIPCTAFGASERDVEVARRPGRKHSPNLRVDVSCHDLRGHRQLRLGPIERRGGLGHGTGSSDAGDRRPCDWTVTHGDGTQSIAEITATPVTDALGADAGYLLVGSDVTEQRQSRDLLVSRLADEAEAAERLRELDKIKDDLVATVSHELRTPLTNILASVELLADEDAGPLTDQQRRLADAMDRNGGRLLALVDDLLTMSTIDAGRLQCESVPLDLRDVITSARGSMLALLGERQLTTLFHLPAVPTTVLGDATQLEHVLCNLLSNAVKFSEHGGTIKCALYVDGSRARITVSDDGIGIPQNEQLGLFKRFFRSSSATDRAIQGTGLGLSIASSIVRAHRGSIAIVSAAGRGTEVTVELPLADARPPAGSPDQASNRRSSTVARLIS